MCLLRSADLIDLVCFESQGKQLLGPIQWRANKDIA